MQRPQPSDDLQSARHVERESDYRFGAIAALVLSAAMNENLYTPK
jgi:hypothetical protein